MKKIFGPKTDDVIGEWIKLHNAGLYNLYFSLNFIRLIRSRRMKEKDLLKDPGIEVRITSEWIFKKKISQEGVGCSCLAWTRDRCVAVLDAGDEPAFT